MQHPCRTGSFSFGPWTPHDTCTNPNKHIILIKCGLVLVSVFTQKPECRLQKLHSASTQPGLFGKPSTSQGPAPLHSRSSGPKGRSERKSSPREISNLASLVSFLGSLCSWDGGAHASLIPPFTFHFPQPCGKCWLGPTEEICPSK